MNNIENYNFLDCRKKFRRVVLISFFLLYLMLSAVSASDGDPADILPTPECADGWVMYDKIKIYNRENLFDRINGEAELYFPYGFQLLASTSYKSAKNAEHSLDVDVYKMGSALDAFGIYSSYRRADDETAKIGAEGSISSSLAIFYQGRYFVRLQASGVLHIDKNILLSCGSAISRNIHDPPTRPRELDVFSAPYIIKGTERYAAKSLLGYEFLSHGLTADIELNGKYAKVFIIQAPSVDAAMDVFDKYRSYLKAPLSDIKPAGAYRYLSATDPLYGSVVAAQRGVFVFGVLKAEAVDSKKILDDLNKRLGN